MGSYHAYQSEGQAGNIMLHAETDTAFAVWEVAMWVIVGFFIIAGIFFAAFASSSLWNVLGWLGGGLGLAGLTFGVWFAVNYPPFASQYHSYVPITVTVQQIGNRIINGDNNSVTQRVAVLGYENGNPNDQITLGCDDTRCEDLNKGNIVTLLCEQEYETNGVPGWTCNWGKLGPND